MQQGEGRGRVFLSQDGTSGKGRGAVEQKTRSGRVILFAVVVLTTVVASGCYYHDFDLMTVDRYTHYGNQHSVDARFFHGDGVDDI